LARGWCGYRLHPVGRPADAGPQAPARRPRVRLVGRLGNGRYRRRRAGGVRRATARRRMARPRAGRHGWDAPRSMCTARGLGQRYFLPLVTGRFRNPDAAWVAKTRTRVTEPDETIPLGLE